MFFCKRPVLTLLAMSLAVTTNAAPARSSYAHHHSYSEPANDYDYIVRESADSGQDGRNGRPGITQNPQTIRLISGKTANPYYNLAGTDGEDGASGEPGESARRFFTHHYQSDYSADYTVVSAHGGDGGNGGRHCRDRTPFLP